MAWWQQALLAYALVSCPFIIAWCARASATYDRRCAAAILEHLLDCSECGALELAWGVPLAFDEVERGLRVLSGAGLVERAASGAYHLTLAGLLRARDLRGCA